MTLQQREAVSRLGEHPHDPPGRRAELDAVARTSLRPVDGAEDRWVGVGWVGLARIGGNTSPLPSELAAGPVQLRN
jgi:hypothetical protein